MGDLAGDESSTTEPLQARKGLVPRSELAIYWADADGYCGQRVLRGSRLRIGRGPDCQLRIAHPSVSRNHAELYRQGPIYAVRDCASRNGTYVNGVRVEHAPVSAGDVLRFGQRIGILAKLSSHAELQGFSELAPGLHGAAQLAWALRSAKAAAHTDVPIVLVGETGTGKERVARAVHHWSARTGRFVAINCSALPAQLAEAELFGHQRGAFTGAERARPGYFQAAHGGTLFLDEIGDMPLEVQAKLLRAIEERAVVPLGSTETCAVDVRMVSGGQEDLQALVQRGKFRADLRARLEGFVVEVPPLRQRREEIPGLLSHFAEVYGGTTARRFDADLLERACLLEWPANVRELELLVRKLVAVHPNEAVLQLEFAEPFLFNRGSASKAKGSERPSSAPPGLDDRRAYELHRLNDALEEHAGNLKAAAASAGISRRRAYRLLERNPVAAEERVALSGSANQKRCP